jgi:membrane associated rhomboid family serine protease
LPIPLKDNVPTLRLPIVTIVLILVNVGFFVWQLTSPTDRYSSSTLERLGLNQRDQKSAEYGAIPYRLLHPGEDCAAGVTEGSSGPQADVVCEGTDAYDQARASGQPFEKLDEAPWFVTAFTSMFMHGGILHLAGNMLFLWIFGNNIEDSMGKPRFVAFYLLGGVAAALAQVLISPDSTIPLVGASGAIAAVLGGYALLYPHARVLTLFFAFFIFILEIPAMVLLGLWILLQFLPAIGQLATPDLGGEGGVAYFAHIGGFIFGLAAIQLFAKRRSTRYQGRGPKYPVY